MGTINVKAIEANYFWVDDLIPIDSFAYSYDIKPDMEHEGRHLNILKFIL